MNASLPRRLAAEFVGTVTRLVQSVGPRHPRALRSRLRRSMNLSNGRLDYAGLGLISLAFSLAVALAIYTVGTTFIDQNLIPRTRDDSAISGGQVR